MSSTFKILFIVRKSRIDREGLTPVVIRVTIDGEALEFSSKIRIHPGLWDAGRGRLTGRTRMAVDANTALEKINRHLRNKYSEVEDKLGYVTPELLRNAFLGVEEKKTTLLSLADRKVEQKKALAGASIKDSAVGKYENTRCRLEEFIPEYCKTRDIGIKEVDYGFIMGFDTFLRTKYRCGHNTVVKYLRYLKQITSDALKSGLIRTDPFMDIPLSSRKGHREYLTGEELEKMISRDFVSEILKETRDIFVFCCMTGFAYADVAKLTTDDITEDNGRKYIIKDRTKTGTPSFVPLLKTPLKIIEKYQRNKLPGNKLLPVSACQVMNRYLKEVASLCGINKDLSTHRRRHDNLSFRLKTSELQA